MGISTVLGYGVSNSGLEADVLTAIGWLRTSGQSGFVACANPHSLAVASRDPLASEALHSADILLPDGVGVVKAAHLFGCPVREKVIGYDFFLEFSERLHTGGGGRYFFLGSTNENLREIASRLNREYPSITVCGTFAPPFADEFSYEENMRMIEAINQSQPDVLWVGMTAPKQEKWVHMNRHLLTVPCIAAVGAVFDFYSGAKRRPPLFWQRTGFEWLYRLCREPARLWERTVVSAPLFVWMVLSEWLRQRRIRQRTVNPAGKSYQDRYPCCSRGKP